MRRVKTTAAPSTSHPASRSSPTVKLPVRSFKISHRKWTAETGQIARRTLIPAMPAAADAPVRKLAGNGQNIGGTEETPICAKQSSAMTMMGLEISRTILSQSPPSAMPQRRVLFAPLSGRSADEQDAVRCPDKRQSGQQSRLGIADAKVSYDCWQEKRNSVTRRIQAEIHKARSKMRRLVVRLKQRKMFNILLCSSSPLLARSPAMPISSSCSQRAWRGKSIR